MSFMNQCWECGLTSFGANTCRSINKSNDHRPDRRENSKFCSTFRTNFMTAADNSTAEVSLASLESIAVPDKHPHNTVLHDVSFEVHPGQLLDDPALAKLGGAPYGTSYGDRQNGDSEVETAKRL